MLFGRQDSNAKDEKHSDYVSSLGTQDTPQDQTVTSNPALPPDDSIFAPQKPDDGGQDQPSDTPQDAPSPQPEVSPFAPAEPNQDSPAPAQDAGSEPTTSADDLLGLKQEALDHLTPLVDHLEQTPEERFRTTMMMIQSTDNQALLKDAFSAAKEISDDKVRAQALLDVINEINYFTQKG